MIFNMVVSGSGGSGDLPWQTFVGNPLEFYALKAHALQSVTVGFEPIQSGSGDPSPNNIRPISGWTGCNVTRTGKNLIDDSVKMYYMGNVYFAESQTGTTAVLPSGTYTFSVVTADGTDSNLYAGNADTNVRINTAYNATTLSFTLTETTPVRLWVYKSGYTTASDITSAQLEVGSSATTYESYSGTSLTASWQTEAGTVYGGTIDVATGVLTVEWAKYIITTDILSGNPSKESNLWRVFLNGSLYGDNNSYKMGLCNSYTFRTSYAMVNTNNNSIAFNYNPGVQILIHNDSITTANELIASISNQSIECVYPLATPQTYQLTAQQVQAIVGHNVMWTDCVSLTVQARGTNV